jgi:hypothetical protein
MDGLIEQAIADVRIRGLIIVGESSLGKTYRVKKKCDAVGLSEGKDYLIHSGHTTPMRLYVKLHNNSDKIHIFDDVDILSDKTSLNLLKATLDKNTHGIVEYDTSRKMPPGVKDKFIFTGKVIILLNNLPKNNEHFRAVKNRVMSYELCLTREQRLNLLHERAKNEHIEGTTEEERLSVVDWISNNTKDSTTNLNYRLYEKAINFYIHQKPNWQLLTKTQIEDVDGYTLLILDGLDEKSWCEKTGLRRRSFYVYKQKAKKVEETALLHSTAQLNSDDKTSKVQECSDFLCEEDMGKVYKE